MRIGIDARFYGSVGKGLGRYTQKLIENLEKISTPYGNRYFIFLRKENWEEYQPQNNNFTKVLADIPWYSVREQIIFPRILKRLNLDLVHFPHFNVPYFYSGKFVVTIHDLILFHFPTRRASTLSPLFYRLKLAAYKIVIKNAVRNARAILAVSEHTRKDILKHFKTNPDKVFVTHEAVDLLPAIPSDLPRQEVLKKYGIMKPYILYVGNAYPHKNLDVLATAFREVIRKHPLLRLVLVGKEDYFYRRLKKFVGDGKIKNIIFAGFVGDNYLPIVYQEAQAYIFPSLYEGFGLPPLEAMREGTPVISSESSCLPDILGEAAYYFDPKAAGEIAEAIEKALIDKELREKLISAGRRQIKKYNWEKMARETLKVYETA
ncbi:MAG: glycosyltransferase family 1 protein [Candidatus Moranbacteria bacterium]|nr:glycosyltransferase family 1 protein [Candidatus Moranbacteria bacterium]